MLTIKHIFTCSFNLEPDTQYGNSNENLGRIRNPDYSSSTFSYIFIFLE